MTSLSSLSKAKIAFCAGAVFILLSLFAGVPVYGGVACILMIGLGLFFIFRIEREIERTRAVCHALALGDFEARITNIKEGGAFGAFQWTINEMTDNTDSFVREATAAMEYVSRNQYFRRILEDGMHGALLNGARIINRATEGVASKMDGFVGVASDVDTSLKDVVSQINVTVNALEDTASTMGSTVRLTREGARSATVMSDETSRNVQAISAAAEEMSSAIAEITQQMNRTSNIARSAVGESEDARRIVEALAGHAQQIGVAVELIQKIADQTNLLALNATIEASRAGDAGKGFAVVAAEVKDLASQTSSATQEISKAIGDIQQATDHAVKAFAKVGNTIGEINEAATVVAAAIEEQSAASKEIAASAERASTGTTGVAGNVKEIDQSVGQVDEASRQVTDVTSQLSEHANRKVNVLLGKMNHFMEELRKVA